jgi:5'-3' exonuclease
MANYILIDGSYFVFFRYFSTLNWFRLSHPDDDISTADQHVDFIAKFNKTFITAFQQIPIKLNIEDPVFIVGKDCPRKDIWRMEHFNTYKSHRTNDDSFMIGDSFISAYKNLFSDAGSNKILYHPHLEADDCIALATKQIKINHPNSKIWIITSDMDYLQLAGPGIELINLKFKKLTDSKNCFQNPQKDLFCKIVMGDKSDGIKSIFNKCGIKTASKCYDNPELFKEKLEKENAYERFLLNKKIIDFNEIPKNMIEEFHQQHTF